MSQARYRTFSDFEYAIVFGLLAVVTSYVRVQLPGAQSLDPRPWALLLGAVVIRRWPYVLLLGLVSGLGAPMAGLDRVLTSLVLAAVTWCAGIGTRKILGAVSDMLLFSIGWLVLVLGIYHVIVYGAPALVNAFVGRTALAFSELYAMYAADRLEAPFAALVTVIGALALRSRYAEGRTGATVPEEIRRLVFEESPLGLVHFGPDGIIQDCNKVLVHLLGSRRDHIVGHPIRDLVQDAAVLEALSKCMAGEKAEYQGRYMSTSGNGSVPLHGVFVPLRDEEGAPAGGVIMVDDLSRLWRAEQEIGNLAKFALQNPDPVMRVTVDGTVAFANAGAAPLLAAWGVKKGQRIGPDQHAEALEAVRLGRPVSVEQVVASRHWHLTFAPDPEALYLNVYARDITDLREAEQHVRESEAMLSSLFVALPLGVALVAEGSIRWANATLADLVGRPDEDLTGEPIDDFFESEDERSRVARVVADQIAQHGLAETETVWRRRDGSTVDCALRATAFEEAAPAGGYVLAVTDISQAKRQARERRNLEARMQHAHKMESLGVLAGGIAHDFNNLLMAILGNADLARQHCGPDHAIFSNLAAIETAGRRAADLCRQMLAYGGRGRQVVNPVDINAIVGDMTRLLEISMPGEARLQIELADHLPLVQGDGTQLRQVVMNLVLNAAEALGETEGDVVLSTTTRSVGKGEQGQDFWGRDLREGRYVVFRVSDSGCGMSAEDRQRIFEPFFTTKFMGRGLGLSAVLGIVQRHQGAVRVTTEPGRGSCFDVLLPTLETSEAGESMALPQAGNNGNILIVGEEAAAPEKGQVILENLGYDVWVAATEREALALLKQAPTRVDAVLLDVSAVSHDQARRTLAALGGLRPDLPILLAVEETAAPSFSSETAVAGIVSKPYEWTELQRCLLRAFDQQQARTQSPLAGTGPTHRKGDR